MLNLSKGQRIFLILSSFMALELFSYLALIYPNFNSFIFIFLILSTFILSLYRFEYAFLVIVAEVLIGSMGHLFVIPIFNWQLSVRMALWLAVMLPFVVRFVCQIIKSGSKSQYYQAIRDFKYLKYFALLAIFIVISLINAYLRGHALNLVFSDANSWLYYLLIFPAITIYSSASKKTIQNLKIVFIASALWISLKTLFLLFVFTHNLAVAPEIYFWLRKTLVAEMTPTLSGWPRIFIQGQIFSALAFFIIFWTNFINSKKEYFKKIQFLFVGSLFASALLISFSRSFWVALIFAFIFNILIIWRNYTFRKALFACLWVALSFLFAFFIIYLVAIFPYPSPGKFNADFISRVSNSNEAALTSRWSLLPVLVQEIKKEPILGQGFGATISYKSSDPRVLQNNPSGEYTTYAFEWGYLDLWLKIGFLGLVSYLLLIIYLLKDSLIQGLKNKDYALLGLSSGIIFLVVTNFFTPYLNHPLGMIILLIGSCLIRKDRVY